MGVHGIPSELDEDATPESGVAVANVALGTAGSMMSGDGTPPADPTNKL